MPLPLARAAVGDLQHAPRELLRVVAALSDADWERPVPYGEWTVKDLITHCIGDMSPSGAGLILAGVLTPQFIADTARTFDVRARNAALADERRGPARRRHPAGAAARLAARTALLPPGDTGHFPLHDPPPRRLPARRLLPH